MNPYPPPGGQSGQPPGQAPTQEGYGGAPPPQPYGYPPPPPPPQGAFGAAPPPFGQQQPPPPFGQAPPYGQAPSGAAPQGAFGAAPGSPSPFGQPQPQQYAPPPPQPYGQPAYPGPPGTVNVYAPPNAQGGQFHGAPGMPGYFPIAQPHPKAMQAMIMGILGWMGCGILSPFAWYYGAKARREIRANPQVYSGESEATAGMWLGAVHTCVFGLVIGLAFVFGVIGAFLH